MKKIFTLIALLSFLLSYGQFREGIIYDKTGKEKKGLIKVKKFDGIIFKLDENSKEIYYDEKHIIGYDIKKENDIEKYRYKIVENASFLRPMKMEISGKISLFSVNNSGTHMIPMGPSGVMTPMGSFTKIVYFIEKDNRLIRTGTRLDKKTLELFQDCYTLIEKLDKNEIKKREVEKIVNFYNSNCNN
ncbi:hypothetical protein [Lutibacter maritimus]|uniref:Uncharacterized protein n=1 Tax=Lutibacter maritimus TaxID=593133 RepID=A0A1I6NVK2_9FLAO|nr:hypothetical protein [Lutibacter maritimus]SFS31977.1 hypothetical protein SAMN04488006_0626 [Lutibacter maritimus]